MQVVLLKPRLFIPPQKKITTLKILTYIMAATTGIANSHILQPQMVATME